VVPMYDEQGKPSKAPNSWKRDVGHLASDAR
jgi:hypothetical protein